MNKDEIKKYLTPKNDVVFKRLFGKKGNERLIKDFLEAVLSIEIESVDLGLETQLIPDKIDEKLGILDVRVNLSNGMVVDVEMQNVNYKDIPKRMTYYLNQLYIGEISKGKSYNELNKAIAIGILDFNYFEEIKEYHTIWKMTEQNNKDKTLEEQEIHFIELPKFLKSKVDTDKKLDQWLLFIDYSRKELIKMAEEKNEMIKEAKEEYEYLTGEEDLQRIAFLKRKFELDYNTGMEDAEERGIEKGEKANTIKIAKKMLEKKMDINLISEITGLSIKEIEKL